MSPHLVVTRSRLSLQPLRDPSKPPAWDNNDGNNSLDLLALFGEEGVAGQSAPLFVCRAQTVANLEGLFPGARYFDTMAPGPFQLRAFVEPRQFWCQPHGICNARTLRGDLIGPDSITLTNPNRWLVHDWRKLKPNPDKQDTRVAWSAGCIVIADSDLDHFGAVLIAQGVNAGDLIGGVLEMEA